jgi:hypothetical protein
VAVFRFSLLSTIPFERWEGNKQIPISNFSNAFIQWTRRWSTDHIAKDIKMTIMAWTDVNLLLRMPGNMTSQMCANIGENPHFTFTFLDHIETTTGRGTLPPVNFGLREFKSCGDANGVIIERPKINYGVILRFTKRW